MRTDEGDRDGLLTKEREKESEEHRAGQDEEKE